LASMKNTLTSAPVAAPRRSARRSAFTMIELLTVIAIIAILAAIIFPVFGTARAAVRRGACISNMQKLSQAVKLFQLDNRRYPDYLYGPALNGDGTIKTDNSPNAELSMSQVATYLRTTINSNTPEPDRTIITRIQRNYRNSLYPEYINDLSVYKCPNNVEVDRAESTAAGLATRLEQTAPSQSGPVTQAFYKYDSYDANPMIDRNTRLPIPNSLAARYSRVWQPLLNRQNLDQLSVAQREDYQNQLVFREPGSDTYITMCTFHAQNDGKVIVLWLNGQAKVWDVRKLQAFLPAGGPPPDFDVYRAGPGD
jgi:prepilin-type N-terminal cleavage/methylation domain-containing protein